MRIYNGIGWMRAAICAAVALILLQGCDTGRIPRADNFLPMGQKVARSANHWNAVADDVAVQTEAAIGDHKPLYLSAPREQSDFSRAFHNLLLTRLVSKGIPVSSEKKGAIEVQYEAQVIVHSGERWAYRPGAIVSTPAGLMVAYNVPDNWRTLDFTATSNIFTDGLSNSGPSRAELLITTTAAENGRYILRKSDVYYIEAEDIPLFLNTEKMGIPAREFRVVGGK